MNAKREKNIIKYVYASENIIARDSLLYYINRAGIAAVGSGFHIERTGHPYCILHYLISGSGTVKFMGKQCELGAGKSFILNPYEPHEYTTDPDDPWEFVWIEFAGGDSARIANHICKNGNYIHEPPLSTLVNKYLLRIMNLLKNKPSCVENQISKLIYSLLINMIHSRQNAPLKNISPEELLFIEKVTNYIKQNLGSDLSIANIAKLFNLSPFYFTRHFHKLVGQPPAKYIFEQRIVKAREMLATTNMKISIIAEMLGFCSTNHFISGFKKIEGVTPAVFRKQCIV